MDVSLDINLPESDTLAPERAAHILAIVQETLANIIRHSKARLITVSAFCVDNQLRLRIEDDGIGISPQTVEGHGMKNIARPGFLAEWPFGSQEIGEGYFCSIECPLENGTMNKIRVALVDDHALVRLGLRTLIDDQLDMEVVGEAGTASEALRMAESLRPQVVLMDIRLPGEGGLEATRQIQARFPEIKVVILTSFADEELVMSAIRSGAVGYLLKEVGNEEVLRGIRAAAKGESVMDPSTTTRLFARVRATDRKEDQDAFRDLTDREMAILFEVEEGKTNAEIAQSLNISEKTARNYVRPRFWKSCN